MIFSPALNQLPSWDQLCSLSTSLGRGRISDLFKTDPDRTARFTFSDVGLTLDLSKQLLDPDILTTLCKLAEQSQLTEGIAQLFSAEQVNFTERRAVLHMASRFGASSAPLEQAQAMTNFSQMEAFANTFHAGMMRGASGHPLKYVVNLGIGGSDLGPRLVVQALTAGGKKPVARVYFVASVDPADLAEVLAELDAAQTLFIVSSKSFTTPETLSNAMAAKEWLVRELGVTPADTMKHFVGVTNDFSAASEFGIPETHIFSLPNSVGGRFSVWSSVGLPALLAIGVDRFREFLDGGREMDTHFSSAPFATNLPVLMALVALWNGQFLNIESLAVLPYSHALRGFPGYLQQLEMESNGKSVMHDGQALAWHTAQIVWGAAGTNGQHAFHQLFYQGTRRCCIDFIVPTNEGKTDAHRALVINARAQAQALMEGQTLEKSADILRKQGLSDKEVARLAPHSVARGNQPSSSLLFSSLTPKTLGALIALYEHKTFVLGWLWGINSFDQFGVELGKTMARSLQGTAHA